MPLYSAGARLEHFYPISAVADGQGLNMTVQSYNGNLDFGFVADRELVPDVWRLTELMHESMDELLTAVRPRAQRSTRRAARRSASISVGR